MMKKEQLGKNLKYMRECHNMSQSQLAGKLWLDRSSISGYEIGKRNAGYLDFVGNGRDYERISGRVGRKKKDE